MCTPPCSNSKVGNYIEIYIIHLDTNIKQTGEIFKLAARTQVKPRAQTQELEQCQL